MNCPGCKEPVRFWQKKCEGNSSWHYNCMLTSDNAHTLAHAWSERECKEVGLPTPWELSQTKGSIGERYADRMLMLLKKYDLLAWYDRR